MPAAAGEGRIAFRYRDYRLFWATRLITVLSSQIVLTTLGWQVYALTGDPMSLGFIGLAVFVPVISATLPAGQLADRHDRRNIYRASQLGQMIGALGLMGLTIADVRIATPFYAMAALYGLVRTFAGPASQALVPNLLPREHFPNAVAWNVTAFQIATIVGPALAGLILHLAGEQAAYATAAVLCALAFGLVTAISTRSTGTGTGHAAGWAHLLGGIRYVWKNPLILGATTLDLFAVLLGSATALLPVFARDILHVGEGGFGLLRSAPAIGGVAMAFYLAHRPLRTRVGYFMFAAVGVFGLCTIVFGLSRSFALSMAALAVMGAADMISVFVRTTLVQIATPDDMRGRVSAVNMVFISASNELGDVESGFVAAWIGSVPAVIAGGVGTVLVTAIWAWRFPQLRLANRLDAE